MTQSTLLRTRALLLWLALLVPLAHSVATWHEFSHLGSSDGQRRESAQSSHSTPCELCLAAAVVSGGALLATAAPLDLPDVREARPLAVVVAAGVASPPAGYQSRAPPLSLS